MKALSQPKPTHGQTWLNLVDVLCIPERASKSSSRGPITSEYLARVSRCAVNNGSAELGEWSYLQYSFQHTSPTSS